MPNELDGIEQAGTPVDPFEVTPDQLINPESTEETEEVEGEETPTEASTEKKPSEEATPASEGEKEEETEEETTEDKTKVEETEESKGTSDKETDEEKELPFHKHPRFTALIDEKNDQKDEIDSLKQTITDIQANKNEEQPTNEIPASFVELYGDDPKSWALFQDLVAKSTKGQIDAFVAETEKQQGQQFQRQKEANKSTEREIQRLADDGKKFDKVKFKEVMVEYQPTKVDENGEAILDFDKGYKIYEALQTNNEQANTPAKNTAKKVIRKKVINSDTQSNQAGDGKQDFYTPQTFSPWKGKSTDK